MTGVGRLLPLALNWFLIPTTPALSARTPIPGGLPSTYVSFTPTPATLASTPAAFTPTHAALTPTPAALASTPAAPFKYTPFHITTTSTPVTLVITPTYAAASTHTPVRLMMTSSTLPPIPANLTPTLFSHTPTLFTYAHTSSVIPSGPFSPDTPQVPLSPLVSSSLTSSPIPQTLSSSPPTPLPLRFTSSPAPPPPPPPSPASPTATTHTGTPFPAEGTIETDSSSPEDGTVESRTVRWIGRNGWRRGRGRWGSGWSGWTMGDRRPHATGRVLNLAPVSPMLDTTLGILSYAAFAVYIVMLFGGYLSQDNPFRAAVSALQRNGETGEGETEDSATSDILQLLVRANSDPQFLRRLLASAGEVGGVKGLLEEHPPGFGQNTHIRQGGVHGQAGKVGYTPYSALAEDDIILFSPPVHPQQSLMNSLGSAGAGLHHTAGGGATQGQQSLPLRPPWTPLVHSLSGGYPLSSLLQGWDTAPGSHRPLPTLSSGVPRTHAHPAHLHPLPSPSLDRKGSSWYTQYVPTATPPQPPPLSGSNVAALALLPGSAPTTPPSTTPPRLSFMSQAAAPPPLPSSPSASTNRYQEVRVGNPAPSPYSGLPLRPPTRFRSAETPTHPHNITRPHPPLHTTTTRPHPPSYTTSTRPHPPSHTTTTRPHPPSHTTTTRPHPPSHTTTILHHPPLHTTTTRPHPPLHTTTTRPHPLSHPPSHTTTIHPHNKTTTHSHPPSRNTTQNYTLKVLGTSPSATHTSTDNTNTAQTPAVVLQNHARPQNSRTVITPPSHTTRAVAIKQPPPPVSRHHQLAAATSTAAGKTELGPDLSKMRSGQEHDARDKGRHRHLPPHYKDNLRQESSASPSAGALLHHTRFQGTRRRGSGRGA